jgi:large subunit ribosomal protein L22
MDVIAKLRFLRMAPRKVRLVTELVKGKTALEAEAELAFLTKRAARPVLKLLQSAMANAENNFKLKKENLFIKKIAVDMGPSLKRWQPRAFGRAAPILKRSSHITLILDEIKAGTKKAKKAAKAAAAKAGTKKGTATKPTERQVVDFKEIKHESKGKKEAGTTPDEQKKKSSLNFKNIKETFTRRSGEK